MSVVITNIPIGAPRERHNECGDLIEWDMEIIDLHPLASQHPDGHVKRRFPTCKTCGEVAPDEIEVS